MEFDCDIVKAAIDDTQSLLVVGDRIGTVHFIHIPSSQIFHSQSIGFSSDAYFACLQLNTV